MRGTIKFVVNIPLVCVCYLDILSGVQEDCSLTVEQASNYPHCKAKMDVRIMFVFYFYICIKQSSSYYSNKAHSIIKFLVMTGDNQIIT